MIVIIHTTMKNNKKIKNKLDGVAPFMTDPPQTVKQKVQ